MYTGTHVALVPFMKNMSSEDLTWALSLFFFLLLLQLKLFHHKAFNTSGGKGGDETAVLRSRGGNSAFGHQSRAHLHFLHRAAPACRTTAVLGKGAPNA